ncbi:unnamed protein product [Linum trigynum]|uniref:Uncharacterized protein n=1 Tax=Linum trigynum TaxID=586398 RepID=A0AAV2CPX2_9ROSI
MEEEKTKACNDCGSGTGFDSDSLTLLGQSPGDLPSYQPVCLWESEKNNKMERGCCEESGLTTIRSS